MDSASEDAWRAPSKILHEAGPDAAREGMASSQDGRWWNRSA